MEKFIEHIEKSLPSGQGNDILYKFKRKTLDEMTQRANQITAKGIHDKEVISDLIISEYPNLKNDYEEYYKKQTAAARTKRKIFLNVCGSLVYIICLVTAFLAVSFFTGNWGQTWVLMVDGVLLWSVYLLALGVKKFTSMRRIFHPLARIFLAGAVIVSFVIVFLIALVILHIPRSWIIVIAGVAAIFVSDAIYAAATKQKLAIISYLLYIPAVSSMLYIILGASRLVPWNTGWIIIPLSLLLDIAVIIAAIMKNAKIHREVVDTWSEN